MPRPKRTDLFEARLEARGAVKANGRRVPKKGMPQSEAGILFLQRIGAVTVPLSLDKIR